MTGIVFRVVHRLARAGLVLCGVSLVSFLIVNAAPGDYLSDAALTTPASAETIARWRERFALDRPLAEQYLRWAASVVRGEGGYSLAYGTPVAPLLATRALVTLLLAGSALVVSWLLALGAGAWTAVRAAHWDGRAVSIGAAALMGVPDLLIALALLVAAARGGWLPPGGVIDDLPGDASLAVRAASLVRHLALPVVALVLSLAPGLIRHVRGSLLTVLRAPYLVAQRARGVPAHRLLWRGALRAAAAPLISLFGLSLAAVFSASMVIEVILSWPGLGPLMIDAVHARDPHVILAGIMCTATLLVAGNLAADLLLRVADPRTQPA